MEEKFRVAEITKNWSERTPVQDLIGAKFETVINTNHDRGYKLSEWKLTSVLHNGILTETIIAIFERVD